METYVTSHQDYHLRAVKDQAPALIATDHKDPPIIYSYAGGGCMANRVRRLTPTECERLQGFPDGWSDLGDWVDEKGKKHKAADSPRYKALGNSIALPFWQWLANRIVEQCDGEVTMGSCFSGIGGFELCFQRAGAKPVWASEVDSFCIAVTKKHFPEEEEEGTTNE